MAKIFSGVRSHLLWLGVAATMLLLLAYVLLPPAPAEAAKAGTCGGFTVTTGGAAFTGDQDTTIPTAQVGPTIEVQGTYVRFTVVSNTFAVENYTLTGADSPRADKNLPIDAPTVVFLSKVPNHGTTLTSDVDLDISNEGVVLQRSDSAQDMKIQAKDCPQGGLFQMEPEPGTTMTHTLGTDFTYTGPPGTGRLCFSNGAFSGYDSPELATRLSPTAAPFGKTNTWDVAAGGRMGMVIGEDAVEGGCNP